MFVRFFGIIVCRSWPLFGSYTKSLSWIWINCILLGCPVVFGIGLSMDFLFDRLLSEKWTSCASMSDSTNSFHSFHTRAFPWRNSKRILKMRMRVIRLISSLMRRLQTLQHLRKWLNLSPWFCNLISSLYILIPSTIPVHQRVGFKSFPNFHLISPFSTSLSSPLGH